MADSNIVITSTSPQGKVLQKTLTDINPDATNAQLATFGTMLNALTDNQYGRTVKITKVHCDAEAGGGDTRAVPTWELWDDGKTEIITEMSVKLNSEQWFRVKYNGDATDDQFSFKFEGAGVRVGRPEPRNAENFTTLAVNVTNNNLVGTDIEFEFTVPETANYKGATATLTVHVTAA